MKEIALSLIRAAALIFPPLVGLLENVLADAPVEHKELADAVRDVLPVQSETERALAELERGRS